MPYVAALLLIASLLCEPLPSPAAVLAAPGVPASSATNSTHVAASGATGATRWPLATGSPLTVEPGELTALARYVGEDDGAYRWELKRTTDLGGLTVFDIRFTSQKWRTETEVSEPLWTHWLTIGVPHQLKSKTPILIIAGGRRREEPRDPPAEMVLLARSSGAVVCALDNVPNQPLRFEGEDTDRFEDNLLARSWVLAMRDDDSRWIGRFPMVKAVKRAMDASEEFLAGRDLSFSTLKGQSLSTGLKPDGFFVTGASKRGWTTWLIAAVDPRVKAIAPIVIDMLNMRAHTPHHFAAYGFWAPALKDYVANGIDKKFGTPEMDLVGAHEDPAAYMASLERLPKFIVTATGDEFFPTDSARHYEKLLKGEWHLRSVPNAGHSLKGTMAPLEILAYYNAFVAGIKVPTITWEPAADNAGTTLSVTATDRPTRVLLWQCDNPKARDFRLDQTGPGWTSGDLKAQDDAGLKYEAHVSNPEAGWRAFMVECTFASPAGPLVFTTRVFVTPDTLPFAR